MRPSTAHNIKGRNLNSNTQGSKPGGTKTQHSIVKDLEGTSSSQILAVNMMPTSQSSAGTPNPFHRNTDKQSQGGGHSSVKHVSQARQSIPARPKSSAQLKRDANADQKQNYQPSRTSITQTSSVLGTEKSGTRIATATLNHFKGSQNQTNMSHMVTRDEDDSILDLR